MARPALKTRRKIRLKCGTAIRQRPDGSGHPWAGCQEHRQRRYAHDNRYGSHQLGPHRPLRPLAVRAVSYWLPPSCCRHIPARGAQAARGAGVGDGDLAPGERLPTCGSDHGLAQRQPCWPWRAERPASWWVLDCGVRRRARAGRLYCGALPSACSRFVRSVPRRHVRLMEQQARSARGARAIRSVRFATIGFHQYVAARSDDAAGASCAVARGAGLFERCSGLQIVRRCRRAPPGAARDYPQSTTRIHACAARILWTHVWSCGSSSRWVDALGRRVDDVRAPHPDEPAHARLTRERPCEDAPRGPRATFLPGEMPRWCSLVAFPVELSAR